MENICYTCKKKLGFLGGANLDYTYNFFVRTPPAGMTPNDLLCQECVDKLPTHGEPTFDNDIMKRKIRLI